MKKLAGLAFAILLLAVACEKDDSSSDAFSNKLTLGTGLNPANAFELTGEATEFTAGSIIYFRLESKDDMEGSPVRINIQEAGNAIDDIVFPSLQDYGHIYLSSFIAPIAGTYVVTGILTQPNKYVATTNLTTH